MRTIWIVDYSFALYSVSKETRSEGDEQPSCCCAKEKVKANNNLELDYLELSPSDIASRLVSCVTFPIIAAHTW